MTWYEAEQIDEYLHRIETDLEQWSMDAVQMRYEQTQLERVIRKLDQKAQNESNPKRIRYIHELVNRISNCEEAIQERLKR